MPAESPTPCDNAEVLEAIRLLHERVSRIEAGAQEPLQLPSLPTKWNPFSGASKSELERLAALEMYRQGMEQQVAQIRNSIPLLTALIGDIYRVLALIQGHVGMQPTQPPPYAPPPPQGFAPQPAYPQPTAPEYAPSAPPYAPSAPPYAQRLKAEYARIIRETPQQR